MNNVQKIIVAIVGSGIAGGLAYTSGLYPDWSVVFGAVSLATTGTMAKIIGWTITTK